MRILVAATWLLLAAASACGSRQKQTENLLDKAKPQITSTLRAGKDMLRPAESGSPRPHEAGTDPSRPVG